MILSPQESLPFLLETARSSKLVAKYRPGMTYGGGPDDPPTEMPPCVVVMVRLPGVRIAADTIPLIHEKTEA